MVTIELPEGSEKAMATHSSTLAWKIPWTEEPGRLQSMGSLRVGHDWSTSLSLFTFMHWRRKWQPTPVFLPGESQGRRSQVGCRLWGRTESDMTEATQQQQQQHAEGLSNLSRSVWHDYAPFRVSPCTWVFSMTFQILTISNQRLSHFGKKWFHFLCSWGHQCSDGPGLFLSHCFSHPSREDLQYPLFTQRPFSNFNRVASITPLSFFTDTHGIRWCLQDHLR